MQYKQVGINIIIKKAASSYADADNTIPIKFKPPPARFTVSGTVRSAGTGETVIGATIRVEEPATGTVTNEYGFYSLTLPSGGTYRVTISAVGYKAQSLSFTLTGDLVENIKMDEEAKDLQQVTVTASSSSRWCPMSAASRSAICTASRPATTTGT